MSECWNGDPGQTWVSTYHSTAGSVYGMPAPKDPLESATDDQLILELVKRGYAVGRLNENNQLEV